MFSQILGNWNAAGLVAEKGNFSPTVGLRRVSRARLAQPQRLRIETPLTMVNRKPTRNRTRRVLCGLVSQ